MVQMHKFRKQKEKVQEIEAKEDPLVVNVQKLKAEIRNRAGQHGSLMKELVEHIGDEAVSPVGEKRRII
jgi:hypothetical protein